MHLHREEFEDDIRWFFLQKLVRTRRAQERELRRRGRHREFRAARVSAVSAGAARLCATSDVSSQKFHDSGAEGG